jgi:hypothetical protein
MARKQTTNFDEQLATLAKGCRSLTVDGKEFVLPDIEREDSRTRGTFRQKIKPDPRAIEAYRRIEAEERHEANSIFVVLPLLTKSPNVGRALRTHFRLVRETREMVEAAMFAHVTKRAVLAAGCTVTMTRLSFGTLDKDDNLRGALKWVKDSVAAFLLGGRPGERDDGPAIDWLYEQAKTPRGVYGVKVLVEPRSL